ncbi:MAG TPA: nucleotidyltransferase family protein [Kofleriaceae bacterium]|nr:nucleotidyltransferase family protein [Kofleriaceae bacterium]
MTLGAVVLAAGAGTRMGGVAKAMLKTASGRTFLHAIVATAREVGTEEIVVVVAPPYGDAVAGHAHELGAQVVVNPAPERGMASSIAIGFAALGASDAAWLWPVDHPDVAPATLRALVAALGAHDAARPVVAARGGHPPLVARALWPRLAGCAELSGGARAVLGAADVIDVAVADPGCIRDVDTRADLEATR